MLKYRADIDGLRAIAVLAVLIYHAFPFYLPGGFAGVDVFFVISGFLISGLIEDSRNEGDFSYWEFYGHRIRRIFPALIAVLAVVLVAGWLLLLPDEYRRLGRETLAGALFASNFLFWSEASVYGGYFDIHAALKPLQHLWSLGIEEQFYLAWPLAMALIWKLSRGRFAAMALLCALSFLGCAIEGFADPVGTFYAPVTRIWEILLGALLASAERRGYLRLETTARTIAAGFGLALVALACGVENSNLRNPSLWAMLPAAGAVLVIAAGPRTWVNRLMLSNRVAIYFGQISYPLYLWHWPLLSFAAIETFERSSPSLRLAVLICAFALAAATYALIERRAHARAITPRLCAVLVGLVVALGLIGNFAQSIRDTLAPTRVTFPAAQLSWDSLEQPSCSQKYDTPRFTWIFCMASADKPRLLLFGNSHANHLYPGMTDESELARQGVINFGVCWPNDDIEPVKPEDQQNCAGPVRRARQDYMHGVARHIPSLRTVVLAGNWPAFNAAGQETDFFTGRAIAASFRTANARDAELAPRDLFLAGLERSVTMLEKQGLVVVIALDVPRLPYDVRECLERPYRRPTETCRTDALLQRAAQAQFNAGVAAMRARHPRLLVFDPAPVFCNERECRFLDHGQVLMRDDSHISTRGSKAVADAFVAWARTTAPRLLVQ